MVIDNSDCNSFASDDDSEEDECQVFGGSYSTDTDDRKKAQQKITLSVLRLQTLPSLKYTSLNPQALKSQTVIYH